LADGRFEALVDEYGRLVLNVALRILGDADAACDVHQEVFLAIWRRWESYDGRTNWRPYLYRTAVRKAIEHAKRLKRAPHTLENQDMPGQEEVLGGQMRAAELREKLLACLAQMSQRQADVFVLSRLEGLSHEEIAEALGCSNATVRVHLHRAMRRLSRELSDYLT
jgi:RNA polymerase sigma-70 factor (ECF subfamily)